MWSLLAGEIFFMNEHIHHGVQDLKLKSRESLRLKFGLSGVMHSGESEILNFIIEYLRKIKTKFKNTFYLCIRGPENGSEL